MTTNENNAIFIVTNRFFKYVKLISEKETMLAKKWSVLYWKLIFKDWETFIKLNNDRNFKFNSKFWKTIFKNCDAILNMTIVYHFSANGQVEKTNQTIKIVLRYLLIDQYEEKWKDILSQMKYAFNGFQNVFIELSSFEVLYGTKFRNPLFNIIKKSKSQTTIDFLKKRRQIHLNVINVVKMTQRKMFISYDNKHRPSELTGYVYLKMTKTKQSNYHILKSNFWLQRS